MGDFERVRVGCCNGTGRVAERDEEKSACVALAVGELLDPFSLLLAGEAEAPPPALAVLTLEPIPMRA